MADITIVGSGYVGLCTGVVFAHHGHQVRIVDVDERKLRMVREGRAPFHEPGLEQALRDAVAKGRLVATADLRAAVLESEFVFLCVGTPQGHDGAADLSYIRQAARDVGEAFAEHAGEPIVVTKSTVPPGTARDVVLPEVMKASGRSEGRGAFGVASNPEFLKEGSAMKDAMQPDRVVVGAMRPEVAERVVGLYSGFACPKITTDTTTAEMIKYAANAFLALKIGFSNELANVCERLGIDWYETAAGIGDDPRIGPLFLRAGSGFGGSCFPKDVSALRHVSRKAGAPSLLLDAVLEGNERQPMAAVRMLREELGTLVGKRIALLGLAFKPDTDDVRETRALPMLRALEEEGADVVCHDPAANKTFRELAGPRVALAETVEEALEEADGCIVQTEWREYRQMEPALFVRLMRDPIVVDGRRTFEPHAMWNAGVKYRAIGLGKRLPPATPPTSMRSVQRT